MMTTHMQRIERFLAIFTATASANNRSRRRDAFLVRRDAPAPPVVHVDHMARNSLDSAHFAKKRSIYETL